MELVLLTALAVGASTVIGAGLGFLFQRIPHRFHDAILGFAAGVMLAAAIIGLILPAAEIGGNIWVVAIGLLIGAVFLNLMDRFTPHLHSMLNSGREEAHHNNGAANKVLLFVMAIAIHNLPEGIAAGVSFGTEDVSNAFSVAAGICLQNVPEGMVIIAPLLSVGISRWKTFALAASTGLVEVAGTLLGFFSVQASTLLLPFALAFAGGTMLYVISDEMIPETHAHGYERLATYSLLVGFLVMLVMDFYMGA